MSSMATRQSHCNPQKGSWRPVYLHKYYMIGIAGVILSQQLFQSYNIYSDRSQNQVQRLVLEEMGADSKESGSKNALL